MVHHLLILKELTSQLEVKTFGPVFYRILGLNLISRFISLWIKQIRMCYSVFQFSVLWAYEAIINGLGIKQAK